MIVGVLFTVCSWSCLLPVCESSCAFVLCVCVVKGVPWSSSGAHPAEADICGWWTDTYPTRRLRCWLWQKLQVLYDYQDGQPTLLTRGKDNAHTRSDSQTISLVPFITVASSLWSPGLNTASGYRVFNCGNQIFMGLFCKVRETVTQKSVCSSAMVTECLVWLWSVSLLRDVVTCKLTECAVSFHPTPAKQSSNTMWLNRGFDFSSKAQKQ